MRPEIVKFLEVKKKKKRTGNIINAATALTSGNVLITRLDIMGKNQVKSLKKHFQLKAIKNPDRERSMTISRVLQ